MSWPPPGYDPAAGLEASDILSGDIEPRPRPECPAWADGRHCFESKVDAVGMSWFGTTKECACGCIVSRATKTEGPK